MNYGVVLFPTEYSIRPAVLARSLEERSFESLLFPEHTHIPASRMSPYPSGGELPKEYSHTLDPFVALSEAQAVTTHLKIGTGICLINERDPIVLAKEVATVDQLSNGRFLFGIGGGWNKEEMRNHGVEPKTRMSRLEETIAALREIWSNDVASYHGRFINFDDIWCWPKPTQSPAPPILLGGNSSQALGRAAKIADEWMPILSRQEGEIADIIARFERACHEADRERLPITFYGAPAMIRPLATMIEHGVNRAIFWLPSQNEDATNTTLDEISALISQLE